MITYNHEEFIQKAIEGVLLQKTSFDVELIIGEDCSIDKTKSICLQYEKQHPGKVTVKSNEKNLGIIPNFLKTLNFCQGKYIALCEGDDYWTDPLKLQKQVDFLEANEDFSLCFGKVATIRNGRIDSEEHKKYYDKILVDRTEFTIEDIIRDNFIATCSVVFRTKNLIDYPSWSNQLPFGDWTLNVINAGHGKIKYIDELMAVYRVHEGGVWSSKPIAQRQQAIFDFYKLINKYFNYQYNELIIQSISDTAMNDIQYSSGLLDANKWLEEQVQNKGKSIEKLLEAKSWLEEQIQNKEQSNEILLKEKDLLEQQIKIKNNSFEELCEANKSYIHQIDLKSNELNEIKNMLELKTQECNEIWVARVNFLDQLNEKRNKLDQIINSQEWNLYSELKRLFYILFPNGSFRWKIVRLNFKILRFFYYRLISIYRKYLYVIEGIRKFINKQKKALNVVKIKNKKWPENRPLISVIIPCFNYGKYVEEAIDSVLVQTFQNFELLVIDGGSTDKTTHEILGKLDKLKTTIYYREGRHLVGDNRNFGINLAKGKYICCLDADDKLDYTYLEKALFFLETYNYDVVYPSVQCFGDKDEVWNATPTTFENMITRWNSVSTVSIFTKEAWKKSKGYKDWPIGKGHVPEDWEFWARLMGNGYKFKNILEPLMLYRYHEAGLTGQNQTSQEEQRQVIYNENKHLLEKNFQKLRKNIFYKVENPFINLKKHKSRKTILLVLPFIDGSTDKTFFDFFTSLSDDFEITIISTCEVSNDFKPCNSKLSFLTIEIFHLRRFTDNEDEMRQFIYYLIESREIDIIFVFNNDFVSRMLQKIKNRYENIIIEDQLLNQMEYSMIDLTENSLVFELLKKYYFSFAEKIVDKEIFTLSVIYNFHREGELAEKTIINLIDTIKSQQLFKLWHDIEIIAVLDNPDELTQNVITKYRGYFDKVEIVDFKGLGASRNHGVEVAKNNFIVFSDGDDYVSQNCLLEIYRSFTKYYATHYQNIKDINKFHEYQHIALFPDKIVEFPNLFIQNYSDSNDIITINMLFFHLYNSKISCHRNLLLKNKFNENHSPYGYEDWDMSNRLLSSGVKFKTSSYTLYYRRNNDQSLLLNQFNNKHIVRNSKLYHKEFIQDFCEAYKPNFSDKYPNFPSNENIFIDHYGDDLFETFKTFLRRYGEHSFKVKSSVPGRFEHPSNWILPEVKIYLKLLSFLEVHDFVYFAPWVVMGGADRVLIEFTRVCSQTSYNPCLITTLMPGERIDEILLPHLDVNTDFPEWGSISLENQMHIFIKAIINSGIKIVHVVQSEFAFQLLKFYKEIFLEYDIKTIASLFTPAYDEETKTYYGYPIKYPEIMRNADIVLGDNNYWYVYYKKLAGQEFNFKKLFSPVEPYRNTKLHFSNNKMILWASRICDQKLIHVLYEICRKKRDHSFVIYGGAPEEPLSKKYFEKLLKLSNIEYRGVYNNINELDINEYDLFLFTSNYEGIATIILDMVSLNLPIITSDIGGLSEVLGKDYKFLVQNVNDPDEYCKMIDEFYSNPELYYDIMKQKRKDVLDKHNRKKFKNDYWSCINSLAK
jgi:glycosyltransferase involved in cell wall biosynthesis